MKKFYIGALIIILCAILVPIIGSNLRNSETESDISATPTPAKEQELSIKDEDKTENNTKEATNPISEPTKTLKPAKTTKPTKTSKPKKESNSTKLFEKIYVPLANREKPFLFNNVSTFIKNEEFKYKITKPTKKETGEINVLSNNGDYVYIAFYPVPALDNIECIMTLSYYNKKSNREVSLDNYSSDNSSSYDTLKTHVIGKQAKEVSSIEEQRTFIFSD